MKEFSIPVTWQVWDKVDVIAETIEEALQYLEDNMEDIPLGTEPEYIDGTHRVLDGHNGQADIATAVKYLMDEWDLSGGITGVDMEDLENDEPYVNRYAEMIHRHQAEREQFPNIVAIGNEALNEGLAQKGWTKEDIRLVHDCGILGCYVHKDTHKDFTDMLANHKQEYEDNISDGIKGELFISEMFRYALSNCEYFVLEDLSPILDFLNIESEDFENNPALKSGFAYARSIYMDVYNKQDLASNYEAENNYLDEEMER